MIPDRCPYSGDLPDPKAPAILGITGTFQRNHFSVRPCLRIGKNPNTCDVLYHATAKGISREHCQLVMRGNRMILQDLGSTYGTFVAGCRLAAMQTVELHRGDRFWLGSEQHAFLVC